MQDMIDLFFPSNSLKYVFDNMKRSVEKIIKSLSYFYLSSL